MEAFLKQVRERSETSLVTIICSTLFQVAPEVHPEDDSSDKDEDDYGCRHDSHVANSGSRRRRPGSDRSEVHLHPPAEGQAEAETPGLCPQEDDNDRPQHHNVDENVNNKTDGNNNNDNNNNNNNSSS